MEVISYRELQRIPHRVLDKLIDKSMEKKLTILVDRQYHYEIKRVEE